jgi:hypothetical protein
MGCHGPKSVITVRNGLTFLDLTVQQLEVYFTLCSNYKNELYDIFLLVLIIIHNHLLSIISHKILFYLKFFFRQLCTSHEKCI